MPLCRTLEYVAWKDMRRKCLNRKHYQFRLHGGRGVKVCARWDTFEGFLSDMGKAPGRMVLARKDLAQDFGPDNCVWAERGTHPTHQQRAPLYEMDGAEKTLREWCQKFDIAEGTVKSRLYYGWTLERALRAPIKKKAKS